MTRQASLLAATSLWAAVLLLASACGRVGTLDQPAPLWGARAKAEYRAHKAAEAAKARAEKDDGAPEALDPTTPPADAPSAGSDTLRQQPAPGMRSLPGAPAPPGVLPDPYTRPQ
jgi:hypothetical protein